MRNIVIAIYCDACQDEIEEAAEGANSVLFTVRGETRELDLCDGCIGGSFWTDARPVANKRGQKTSKRKVLEVPKDEFACECGKSFKTWRGLGQHQLRMSHG